MGNIDDAEEKTILKTKDTEKEIKLENTIDTEKEIKLENTIDTEKEIKLETINFSKITNDLEVSRKYHKSEIDKIEEQNVDIINDYKDDDIDLSTLNLKKEGLDSLKIEKLDLDNDLDFIDNDLDFVDNINESQNTQNININAVLPEEIDLENVLPNKITLNETLEKDNNVKKIVIDNKTTLNKYTHDKKKNYNFVIDYVRYIKILLLVACLSYGGLFLSVKSTDNIQTGGGSSISNVNGLNIEEIYTGNPTF